MSALPIGLALVGAGAFGTFCLEAFAALPEVQIRAIVDTDAQRAHEAAQRYNAQPYTRLESILDQPDIAIVALNTPPYLHARQGLAVLNAGKHLFCEKPLALTVEAGTRLVERAHSQGVLLTVNYVMRHNPLWRLAALLRQSGVLGTLRHMSLMNHAAGLELPDDHWFWDPTLSGGIWVEHGVHFFDAFALVAGTDGQIVASHYFTREDGAIDRVEALARYESVGAHFYHAFDQSAQTEKTTVHLAFQDGYVTLHEWVPTRMVITSTLSAVDLRSLVAPHGEALSSLVIEADGSTMDIRTPGEKSTVYQQGIQQGMRALVYAITHEQPESLQVTGDIALKSLRLALACVTSERDDP